ncbi:MAG: cell wall-active antibiotics response protein LiaF [Chloroflexota bacterium]|nr:cell wall-active antibiotics response protein LiaF [Chloroflexota bacterium]
MGGRSFWWQAIGILVIVFGVILLLNSVGVRVGNAPGILLAVVVIVLGVWFVWRSRRWSGPGRETFAGTVSVGGSGWQVKAGRYSVVFGEIKLDLTQATVPDGEHRIDLDGFMGSIVVTVPKEVGVSASGHAFLGSVSLLGQRADGIDRTLDVASPGYAEAAKKLVIHAGVFAGDVRVQYAS